MITKIDVTRDLRGSLYTPGGWKDKHRELVNVLSSLFGCPFKDNGNSFESCFQFKA